MKRLPVILLMCLAIPACAEVDEPGGAVPPKLPPTPFAVVVAKTRNDAYGLKLMHVTDPTTKKTYAVLYEMSGTSSVGMTTLGEVPSQDR